MKKKVQSLGLNDSPVVRSLLADCDDGSARIDEDARSLPSRYQSSNHKKTKSTNDLKMTPWILI